MLYPALPCPAPCQVWYDCPDGSEVSDFVSVICAEIWAATGTFPESCSHSHAQAQARVGQAGDQV